MLVMFDLPVVEKSDRKAASRFRHFLLDEGFAMAQYSVYFRMLPGKEKAAALEKRIQDNLPDYGSVQIIVITDKQYENIKLFTGKTRENQASDDQFILF